MSFLSLSPLFWLIGFTQAQTPEDFLRIAVQSRPALATPQAETTSTSNNLSTPATAAAAAAKITTNHQSDSREENDNDNGSAKNRGNFGQREPSSIYSALTPSLGGQMMTSADALQEAENAIQTCLARLRTPVDASFKLDFSKGKGLGGRAGEIFSSQ